MIGLFILKGQPVHRGHLYTIKMALKDCSWLKIAIIDTSECYTLENPFTFEERKEMIEETMKHHKISCFMVYKIDDNHGTMGLRDHVGFTVGPFERLYSNKELSIIPDFRKNGVDIAKTSDIFGLGGTSIRRMIEEGNDNWKNCIPVGSLKVFNKIEGYSRIQQLASTKIK